MRRLVLVLGLCGVTANPAADRAPQVDPQSGLLRWQLREGAFSLELVQQLPDQIRAFLPQDYKGNYKVLGTDGFGRSDTRKKLRKFFEVDRHYIVVAALKALADEGAIKPSEVSKAIKLYGIDPDKPNPTTV